MAEMRTTEGLTHFAFEWTRDQHRPCVGTRGHCTDNNPDGCGGFLRAAISTAAQTRCGGYCDTCSSWNSESTKPESTSCCARAKNSASSLTR